MFLDGDVGLLGREPYAARVFNWFHHRFRCWTSTAMIYGPLKFPQPMALERATVGRIFAATIEAIDGTRLPSAPSKNTAREQQ